MADHVTITLDVTPPANPSLLINYGLAQTGTAVVDVALYTPDTDVATMKIWGDVDPAADTLVQPTEIAAPWIVYTPAKTVRLSSGSGRKYLYARLRDNVGNPTLIFSDFIDLNADIPVVSVVTPPDAGKISKIAPYHQSTFTWQVDRAFAAYQVRVVPSVSSSHLAGVPMPVIGGSSGVAGSGSFPAMTPLSTTIRGTDLEAASPGATQKVIKVFAQVAGGAWSA